ncbi:MAG: hypothetical protein ACLSHG_13025 [Oscillospiraceae bacterium]
MKPTLPLYAPPRRAAALQRAGVINGMPDGSFLPARQRDPRAGVRHALPALEGQTRQQKGRIR